MSSVARERYPVSGSLFEAELRAELRRRNYPGGAASGALEHIAARGTATGYGGLDAEDVAAVNALYARHIGLIESDPADWPAVFDEDRWVPEEPFEPTEADRAWVTAQAEAREARWDDRTGVRSRPVSGYSDFDQERNHGCV